MGFYSNQNQTQASNSDTQTGGYYAPRPTYARNTSTTNVATTDTPKATGVWGGSTASPIQRPTSTGSPIWTRPAAKPVRFDPGVQVNTGMSPTYSVGGGVTGVPSPVETIPGATGGTWNRMALAKENAARKNAVTAQLEAGVDPMEILKQFSEDGTSPALGSWSPTTYGTGSTGGK